LVLRESQAISLPAGSGERVFMIVERGSP